MIVVGVNRMKIEDIIKSCHINHQIKHFVRATKTYLEEDTLFYKSIPSALLTLNHLNLYGTILPDDGFDVKGTMVDLSRNAVFKIDYFKSVIKRQALLGFPMKYGFIWKMFMTW